MHLVQLPREQLAKERTDIDAGKKIARSSRTLNRAGVVTEVGMVKSGIHERSHGDRAAFTDPGQKIQSYSLRTVTNTSLSPRQTRTRAIRPEAIFCNSRPASVAFVIFWPFTERITSPCRRAPADGPSGSTSVTSAPDSPDGICRRRAVCGVTLLSVNPKLSCPCSSGAGGALLRL